MQHSFFFENINFNYLFNNLKSNIMKVKTIKKFFDFPQLNRRILKHNIIRNKYIHSMLDMIYWTYNYKK